MEVTSLFWKKYVKPIITFCDFWRGRNHSVSEYSAPLHTRDHICRGIRAICLDIGEITERYSLQGHSWFILGRFAKLCQFWSKFRVNLKESRWWCMSFHDCLYPLELFLPPKNPLTDFVWSYDWFCYSFINNLTGIILQRTFDHTEMYYICTSEFLCVETCLVYKMLKSVCLYTHFLFLEN